MENAAAVTTVDPRDLSPAHDPAERAKGVGGSDVAVILGLSPYKTPLDLWLEKTGRWSDDHDSEAAHWGRVMEPVLVREYARRENAYVARREGDRFVSVYPDYEVEYPFWPGPDWARAPLATLGTLVHPTFGWARGHVDAVRCDVNTATPERIVEGKTADLRLQGNWGEPGTDEVPEYYLCQCMWYLMLTGLEVADLAVLIGGNRFATYRIPRSQALIDLLLEHAERFWVRVLRDDPPDPTPDERGKVSLSRLYPSDCGNVLTATPAILELAERLQDACAEMDAAGERRMASENELKAIIADASRLNLSEDGKAYISWKCNKPSRATAWEDVAREIATDHGLPSDVFARIVAAHTSEKPGPRVFRRQGLDKLFARG